jgi:hypothetical protein
MIFQSPVYLQPFVQSTGLGINLKTSGHKHYVQLQLNKQGFRQSLAGQAMNNHYYCKPTNSPLTPRLTGLYRILKLQQIMIAFFVTIFL